MLWLAHWQRIFTCTIQIYEILNDKIQFVINTPMGASARYDEEAIGKTSVMKNILTITTMSGARAAIEAMSLSEKIKVKALQEYFK